jgi:hypothetical protein
MKGIIMEIFFEDVKLELNSLAKSDTFTITKYGLFKKFKHLTKYHYESVRTGLRQIIYDFCTKNKFHLYEQLTFNNKHAFITYYISTKEQTMKATTDSRGRIRIPSSVVRSVGFTPHEIIDIRIYQSPESGLMLYSIGEDNVQDLEEYTEYITNKQVTVEDDNSIRITVGNNIVMPMIAYRAGYIEIY